ncbi:PREDICTED: uncharacterized protein LOC107193025, partial [Dufourea novaeangliae]|uniref:uncharacterized protein LOC107193025 n=1 Tax=Dufourea novaeangliae TaxID=178035 RepID=UPI0007677733
MSRVQDSQLNQEPSYYLPHHAVCKEGSTTTKVRVVFDASAKSSSADITKMYRQILIEPEERYFQRILWRQSPELPIETFELNTVTYGTASAPFLATRVLKQIGLECTHTFPNASKVIINDFYVDDLLTGVATISEAKRLKDEVSGILLQAGLPLRKWATNCPLIFQSSPDTVTAKELNADKDPKTLGLQWASVEDELRFCISSSNNKRVTKRTILSEIAQIFDPLGLIGPVITRAKLMMQRLWKMQIGWDETISQELHAQWTSYRQELHNLDLIKIPRKVVVGCLAQVELHGFADASEKAYGACVYLRSPTKSGKWEARLLCSKSRVAPLKSVTLPRLELCGALLLAQLVHKVQSALNLPVEREYYWSDSSITLAWIASVSSRWNTFVANRVSQIQHLSKIDNWRHVSSKDNPADIISRGLNPMSLKDNNLWWS